MHTHGNKTLDSRNFITTLWELVISRHIQARSTPVLDSSTCFGTIGDRHPCTEAQGNSVVHCVSDGRRSESSVVESRRGAGNNRHSSGFLVWVSRNALTPTVSVRPNRFGPPDPLLIPPDAPPTQWIRVLLWKEGLSSLLS